MFCCLNIRALAEDDLGQRFKLGHPSASIDFPSDLSIRERGFSQPLEKSNRGTPQVELRLFDGSIEFDSLQAHPDQVRLGNEALSESCQVELHELFEGLPILAGDIDAVPGHQRLVVQTFHVGDPAPHGVRKLHLPH